MAIERYISVCHPHYVGYQNCGIMSIAGLILFSVLFNTGRFLEFETQYHEMVSNFFLKILPFLFHFHFSRHLKIVPGICLELITFCLHTLYSLLRTTYIHSTYFPNTSVLSSRIFLPFFRTVKKRFISRKPPSYDDTKRASSTQSNFIGKYVLMY